MPIELEIEIEESGFTANYWRFVGFQGGIGKTPDQDWLMGTFYLYKSAADFATKRNVRGIVANVKIEGDIQLTTTVGQLITALENQIVQPGEALEGGTIL